MDTVGVPQSFPRREAGGIALHRWELDLGAAAGLCGAWDEGPARLRREAAEMAAHLPRWVLTLAQAEARVACARCGAPLVFERGVRCAGCGRATGRLPASARLAWFGLLPPIGLDGLRRLSARLGRRAPPGHVLGQAPGVGSYLLVPLLLVYPEGFPGAPPQACYQPGFFELPGAPRDEASHRVHLYGRGRMCLFAPGEWRPEMTVREVVQQRAYAHVVKMLNWADGKADAFAPVS